MARDMIEAEVFVEADKNPQTEQERIRRLWVTELRRQGHRQCRNAFIQQYRGYSQVCALGLLAEVAGLEMNQNTRMRALTFVSGLSDPQLSEVMFRNDGDFPHAKHTFAEIADVVEAWFP